MSRRKIKGIAALTAGLCLALAGTVAAKPLLQEDFRQVGTEQKGGEIVQHGAESAWRAPGGSSKTVTGYLSYDLKNLGLNPAQGTVEFDLTRDEVRSVEAVFSLLDAAGERLFSFRIDWDGIPFTQKNPPAVVSFWGSGGEEFWYNVEQDQYGNDVLVPGLYLPAITRGMTKHFALVWQGGRAAVYVDGTPLKGVMETPFTLGEKIAAAATLIVGADVSKERPAGAWAMSHSLISNFQVHDVALTPQKLDRPITGDLAITSLSHDAARVAGFSGKLVAGDTVTVTMEGTPGAAATYDVLSLSDFAGELAVSWKGWGVYLEDKAFFDDNEVNLRDVEEYRLYASTEPIALADITVDTPFVGALDVEVQEYIFQDLEAETPYYIAVLALMRDDTFWPVSAPVQGVVMVETAEIPGTYKASFTVPYGVNRERMLVVGHLGTWDKSAVLMGDEEFAVDSRLNIAVETTPQELKADEKSTAEVKVTVTDANGDAVPDHEIRFLLATTSQYTGVVGGGDFAEETGGALELKRSFRSKTDLFGRVKATYTAGFAAKTAIIVARDMESNDTGAGYITTYINATADLVLEPELTAERSKALAGYKMTVTSSDEWLTADGESEARITAMVTLNGQPVEGHRVGFSVSSGTGTIRTVSGTTGADGKARAVYTAGTKIGIVTIEAIDHTIGLVGTVQIELRSDAPAKIVITLSPELLFADGRSTADIEVLVTDINDNPNDGVLVEYAVAVGSGRLQRVEEITDRKGISTAEYVAGSIPGRVTIEVTVRSTVPTEEELLSARDLALAVMDYDFY